MLSNKRSEENDYGIHPSPSQHDFDAFFNPAIFFQVRSEAESSSPSFRLPHHFDSEGDCYPRLLSVRLARKNQSLFRFKIVDIFKSARKDQRLLQILRFLGARCFQGEVYGGRTLELKKSRNVITGSTGWQEIDDDLSSLSTKDDDENVEEDAEQKRLKQFLSSVASKNGNSLQEKLIHARNNIFRNEAWRVFCSRRPFSSAVTLRWVQFVVFVVGLLFLLGSPSALEFAPWTQVQELQIRSYSLVRFRALQLRDGATGSAISNAGIASFGLMRGGCPLFALNGSSSPQSSQDVLSFSSPVSFDGWYFITGNGPLDKDPVKFVLEGSNDGVQWVLISISKWCGSQGGNTISWKHKDLSSIPEFHPPSERNFVVHFNFIEFACLWPEYGYIIARASAGLIMLAAAIVAFLEKYGIPVQIISFGFTILYFFSIISSSVLIFRGYNFKISLYGNPVSLLIEAVVGIAIFPVPLVLNEALVFEQAIFSSVVLIISGFALAASTGWPVISIVILATVLFLIFMRERIRWKGRMIISGDVKLFGRVWSCLLEREENLVLLEKLSKAVRVMTKSINASQTLRQQTVMSAGSEGLEGMSMGSDGAANQLKWNFPSARADVTPQSLRVRSNRDLSELGRSPSRGLFLWERNSPMFSSLIAKFNVASQRVVCLNQLYAQAVCVEEMFRREVKQLALRSRGYFLCKPGTPQSLCHGWAGGRGYMLWEEVSELPEVHRWVEWAELKYVSKALEKLTRSYDSDVSRLVDIVRERVAFDHLQDMLAALEALEENPNLEVVRIKNRLDLQYDTWLSAGYRDICVNVRVKHAEARKRNLTGHICELQLALKPFLELTDEEQHKRYIQFRRITHFQRYTEALHLLRKATTHVREGIVSSLWGRTVRGGEEELQEVRVVGRGERKMQRFLWHESFRERQEASLMSQTRLESIMQQRSCFPGDLLMSRLSEFRLAVKNADTASVLFTDNPVFLSIHKPWIRGIIGLAGIYFLYYFFNPYGSLQQVLSNNKFTARSVSLHFVDPPARPRNLVADLALLLDGCRVSPERLTELDERTMRIDYPADVTANGYTLSTRPAWSGATSFQFSVSYWSASNVSASLTAAPCRWGLDSTACLKIPVGEAAAGEEIVIDLRPPWFAILGTSIVYIPIFIGCLAVPVLTHQGKATAPTAAFAFCFWAPGLMELITAGGLSRSEHAEDSMYWWVIGMTSMAFGYIVQFEGKRFISFIPVNWALAQVALILHNLLVVKPSQATSWVPVSATIMMGFWVVLISLRQFVLFKSWRAIAPDKRKYDSAWEELMAREDNRIEVEKLAKVVVRQDTRNKVVRQTFPPAPSDGQQEHPKFLETEEATHVTHFLCRVKLEGSYVTSLDQLYVQAALLEPLFTVKVQEFAGASRGCFPLVNAMDCFVRWDEVREGNQSNLRIKWAGLKSVDRSIEKLSRSYMGDVSRLVDLVRQCIVFEKIADLRRCLEAICDDPEIEVVRIKNRLDASYHSKLSAGYRDVALNMRLKNAKTIAVGLSNHICELQLVVDRFMILKTSDGHKRYVEFRNKRCE